MSKSTFHDGEVMLVGRITKLFSSDSKSLWNVSVAPGNRLESASERVGWTKSEIEVLRLALMKYGIGSWNQLVQLRILPGKTVSQIVCQAQRLIGQQSLKGWSLRGLLRARRVPATARRRICHRAREFKTDRCVSQKRNYH